MVVRSSVSCSALILALTFSWQASCAELSQDEAYKIAKDAYIFCFPPFGGELRDVVAQCLDLEVAHHLPLKFFASVRIAAAIAFACLTSK